MKFTALPAHDLTDVTLDLEQLQTRDILDQSSTTILQLAVTGTKRKVNGGTGTLVFTASGVSATVTVTHGLGTTPILVLLTCQNSGTFLAPYYQTVTGTSFAALGIATAAITANVPFSWLAIG